MTQDDSRMKTLETRLDFLDKKMSKLETSVMGDAHNPSVFESLRTLNATMHNMNKALNNLTSAVELLKKDRSTVLGIIIGVSFVAGLIGRAIGYFF